MRHLLIRRGVRLGVLGAGAIAVAAIGAALSGVGPAAAAPTPPGVVVGLAPPASLADPRHGIDPAVPRNGFWPGSGYQPSLVPEGSPLQIPAPIVVPGPGAADVRFFPYLPRWLHNGIVSRFPARSAFEIAGAVHLTVPGSAGRLEINPNGHCLFVGGGRSQQTLPADFRRVGGAPVHAEVPLPSDGRFTITVYPRVFRAGR